MLQTSNSSEITMNDMQKLEKLLEEIDALQSRQNELQASADAIGQLRICTTCQRKELFRPGQWIDGWVAFFDCWFYCPKHQANCPDPDEPWQESDEVESVVPQALTEQPE